MDPTLFVPWNCRTRGPRIAGSKKMRRPLHRRFEDECIRAIATPEHERSDFDPPVDVPITVRDERPVVRNLNDSGWACDSVECFLERRAVLKSSGSYRFDR